MSELAVYVMAGGRSSRFGEPKALKVFNGKRLIDHALILAETLSDTVIVGVEKGNPYKIKGHFVLEDAVSGAGPSGGVYSVLNYIKKGWVAVIPCDMPFLSIETYRTLLSSADQEVPVVACSDSGIEPLVSVWPCTFASVLKKYLDNRDFKILNPLLDHDAVKVRFTEENSQILFTNINSVNDFNRWTG